MSKEEEKIRKHFEIDISIEKELSEIKKILNSNEPDDLKFRSVKAIFEEILREMVDTKINAMFESRTGLLSAKFGEEAIAREIEHSKRMGSPFSIAFLDIDFLKFINDNYGHVLGTKIIVAVAQIIKSKIRKYDIACRYGGDEFLLVFPQTSRKKAEQIIKRIKKAISAKKFEKGVKVTVSSGIVECCPKKRLTVSGLLKSCDKELYRSKKKRINVNLKNN